LRKTHKVAVIRTADDHVLQVIPQDKKPDLIMMDPALNFAFVTNRHAGIVSVIDVRSHKVVAKIRVGANPHGVALKP
jgi:YVTN family beta-propeller protein